MKQTLKTKIFNYVLFILGFAATTSCEDVKTECEYGTPTMDFEVSGKVINDAAAPIPGIKVSCRTFSGEETTYTTEDGSFFIAGTAMKVTLDLKDVDGPENGGDFADKSQRIEVEQVKKGDGNWYKGQYEAKDVVITMKEKE